jgi:F0F1-type ATP synthase delta subunit
MKYSANTYAKALVEVLSDPKVNDESAARNFLALVKKNNDEGHFKKILEEASRLARGKAGVRKVIVESARELSAAQKGSIGKFIKVGDVVVERIDPELIAGIRIILDDEMQFDGSLKNKLNRALGTV